MILFILCYSFVCVWGFFWREGVEPRIAAHTPTLSACRARGTTARPLDRWMRARGVFVPRNMVGYRKYLSMFREMNETCRRVPYYTIPCHTVYCRCGNGKRPVDKRFAHCKTSRQSTIVKLLHLEHTMPRADSSCVLK